VTQQYFQISLCNVLTDFKFPFLWSPQTDSRNALLACQSVAVLEHDAPQPARKSRWLSQLGQAVESLDERFLRAGDEFV